MMDSNLNIYDMILYKIVYSYEQNIYNNLGIRIIYIESIFT